MAWTVSVVGLIFFTMVGIEMLGEEIEEPFGEDPNDLPFNGITQMIGENVHELMVLSEKNVEQKV